MKKLVKLKKVAVREGVFETNSSSSHSLVFSPKNTFKKVFNHVAKSGTPNITNEPKKEMLITLEGFGWGRDDYVQTTEEKIAYVLADQVISGDEIEVGKFDEWKAQKNSAIIEWIEDGLNVTLKIDDDASHSWRDTYDAYIDHQSMGTAHDVVVNKETLLNFLTDDTAYVEIDNDNG